MEFGLVDEDVTIFIAGYEQEVDISQHDTTDIEEYVSASISNVETSANNELSSEKVDEDSTICIAGCE